MDYPHALGTQQAGLVGTVVKTGADEWTHYMQKAQGAVSAIVKYDNAVTFVKHLNEHMEFVAPLQ